MFYECKIVFSQEKSSFTICDIRLRKRQITSFWKSILIPIGEPPRALFYGKHVFHHHFCSVKLIHLFVLRSLYFSLWNLMIFYYFYLVFYLLDIYIWEAELINICTIRMIDILFILFNERRYITHYKNKDTKCEDIVQLIFETEKQLIKLLIRRILIF